MKILNKKIIEIIDFIYLFVRNFNIILKFLFKFFLTHLDGDWGLGIGVWGVVVGGA